MQHTPRPQAPGSCHRQLLAGSCLALTLWVASVSLSAAATSLPVTPKSAEHEFHFVVLGDSQFHDPAGYNRLINDLVWLGPAFALQVGDMITGYAGVDQVRAEWGRFADQIGPLREAGIPFLPVAGNHDVLGPRRKPTVALKRVYEQTWGATYYRFDYGNSRFVVLNTDEPGASGRINGPQLEWLKESLTATPGQQHRFVFMHRPPDSLRNANALHRLFVEHKVHTVFYGHHHHYHYRNTDGVQYIMTNAAANSATELPEVGSFDHLLQVSVRDESVRIAVIEADSIQGPDTVAPSDNYDLFALRRGLFAEPLVLRAISADPRSGRYRLEINLHNTSKRDVRVYLHCDSADERWQFAPRALPAIALASGAQQTLQVEAWQSPSARSESLPICTAQFPYQLADGSWHNRSVSAQASVAD